MAHLLVALWKGSIPLSEAFWGYAIVYGTVANIVATAAAIAAVAIGLPDIVAIGFFPGSYSLHLTAVVGVVRSADRYQGSPTRAGMAKVAVIMRGAGATSI